MKENYSPKECEKEIENVIKENEEEGVELTAEEKKMHKLFGKLMYTVRSWPFDDEDNFGKIVMEKIFMNLTKRGIA